MARRRDHAREYAQSKARAKRSGYKSQREYRAVRKTLKLPPRTSPAPRRIISRAEPEKLNDALPSARRISAQRRAARIWSDKHSKNYLSKYQTTLTDRQVEMYMKAFVNPWPRRETPKRIREAFGRQRDLDFRDYVDDVYGHDAWARHPSSMALAA